MFEFTLFVIDLYLISTLIVKDLMEPTCIPYGMRQQ